MNVTFLYIPIYVWRGYLYASNHSASKKLLFQPSAVCLLAVQHLYSVGVYFFLLTTDQCYLYAVLRLGEKCKW